MCLSWEGRGPVGRISSGWSSTEVCPHQPCPRSPESALQDLLEKPDLAVHLAGVVTTCGHEGMSPFLGRLLDILARDLLSQEQGGKHAAILEELLKTLPIVSPSLVISCTPPGRQRDW